MTIEEIRKNAPSGAHFYSFKFGYIKMSYKTMMLWNGRDFNYFYMPCGQMVRI